MKRIVLISALVLLVVVSAGCGKKRLVLKPGVIKNIAVLTLDGNLPGQTKDQKRELDIVMRWMDRDIIKNFKRAGFNSVLIKSRKQYKGSMGNLLIVKVRKFNAGNRAARVFVGFGAGAASLDLSYKLLNERGAKLKVWEDGVGSSYGGTYCAQTLNRRAINTVVETLNK